VSASNLDPGIELHLWHARLGSRAWPGPAGLPRTERERADRLLREDARRRWVAARWALRSVLGGYLGQEPAAIELDLAERGKPRLADADAALRFNLSHSGELALIAIAAGREVGVDVQRIGPRPGAFYAEWTRREAIAKCHGAGLGAPLPEAPVAVASCDAGVGFAAAIAVAGGEVPPVAHFTAEARRSAQ
jgi:phosphopantetheinyl transferase